MKLQSDLFDVKELVKINKPLKPFEVAKEEEDELLKYAEEINEESTVKKAKGIMQDELCEEFQQTAELNEKIKLTKHQKAVIEARKTMKLPYFDNPKNDNEKLLNYQYDFIKHDNQTAWGKLLTLSFEVSKRLVWKWMGENGDKLDEIAQDEKASIAMEYVLRRYNKNIGWYVSTNYITALSEGVKHAMLYKTNKDKKEVELNENFNSKR